MDNTKKTSLKHTLLKFSLVPVLVLGLVLTLISTRTLVQVTTEQVSQSLKVAARSVYNTYSLIAPGDMYEKDGMIYKGDVVLTGDYSIVDSLAELSTVSRVQIRINGSQDDVFRDQIPLSTVFERNYDYIVGGKHD